MGGQIYLVNIILISEILIGYPWVNPLTLLPASLMVSPFVTIFGGKHQGETYYSKMYEALDQKKAGEIT